MKGQELPNILSVLVLGALVAAGTLFIFYTIAETQARAARMQDLNAVSMAYLVEDCLEDGTGQITEVFLNASQDKHLCELCELCSIIAEARVENLQTKQEWEFSYDILTRAWQWLKETVTVWKAEKHASYSIPINIITPESVHVGRLHVEV